MTKPNAFSLRITKKVAYADMPMLTGVIFSLSLVAAVKCSIQDRLISDFFNIYRKIAVRTSQFQGKPVSSDQVTYYLFTKDNSDQYVQLKQDNLNSLSNKKIVFLIHGWAKSREAKWYEDLKNAFLWNYDYDVVQVDWKEPANQFYHAASISTIDVAKIIADLVVNLNKNHCVSLNDVLLIGHSLGGQIVGFIGKNVYKLTRKKLPRIIALDPAGPLFSQQPERLNKDDAEIVEVIHTDGGTFGFKDAVGTIDFFPNGGSSQPGCVKIDWFDIKSFVRPFTCDHRRAYEYFIEAILNQTEFVAKKCENWDSYKKDKCEDEEVAMGDLTTKATGKFFLKTNGEKPFGKIKTIKDL